MKENDPAFERRVRLLMGVSFYWDIATVRVSPHLVDQILRRWGTSSSAPAVKLIQKKLRDYAYEFRDDEQLREDYEELAENVPFRDFWEAVQQQL